MTQQHNPILQASPDYFGALGKVLGGAAHQVQRISGVDPNMVGTYALGCGAGLVQGLVDVKRPNMRSSPISQVVLNIASSGEGKDAAIDAFRRPFVEFQSRADSEAQASCAEIQADLLEWQARRKILLSLLDEAVKGNEPTQSIKRQLAAHAQLEPEPYSAPRILYGDATPQALKEGLCSFPSAVMISTEAGSFFNGHMGADFTFVNSTWGGDPIVVDRARRGRLSIMGARFSAILAVQPRPFIRWLKRRGVEANDSGFTARFLVCCPMSTQGHRFITMDKHPTNMIDAYTKRALQLLEETVQAIQAGKQKRVVSLSAAAEKSFIDQYNHLMGLMAWGQPYFDIPGFASKAAENAARIAAMIHLIDEREGDANMETLDAAFRIIHGFAEQFRMVFVQADMRPTEEHDAQVLQDALVRAHCAGEPRVPRSHLGWWCPELPGPRLKQAAQLLLAQRRVSLVKSGGQAALQLPMFMPF